MGRRGRLLAGGAAAMPQVGRKHGRQHSLVAGVASHQLHRSGCATPRRSTKHTFLLQNSFPVVAAATIIHYCKKLEPHDVNSIPSRITQRVVMCS